MNVVKNIISGVIILLTITILTSCGGENMQLKESLIKFSEIIKSRNFNDLSLTIYYMNPFTLTIRALSVDDLVYGITAVNELPKEKNDINGLYEQKFEINSDDLEKQIDLFNQMNTVNLILEKKGSRLNARIYYVFSTKQDGNILDVAMWGYNEDFDE
jgi:hypothetical protein